MDDFIICRLRKMAFGVAVDPKRKKVGAKNIQKETWTYQMDGICTLALLAVVVL
jgi:hypothetical protein